MRFWRLYLAAWVRGWFYRWPTQPRIRGDYTSVSCGLKDWRECRDMFRHNWEPFCFQRTNGYGIARLFRVPMTAEEIEYERLVQADWTRLADRHYGEEAFVHATLGRPLRWDERLHHINGDTFDCRPENMRIVSVRENRAADPEF